LRPDAVGVEMEGAGLLWLLFGRDSKHQGKPFKANTSTNSQRGGTNV
jgi:hypothetical protein